MLIAGCFFPGSPVSKPSIVNFVQSLIAVIAGNALYFLLMPHLPLAAQHRDPTRLDLGIVVDFWFCLALLGAIKTVTRLAGRSSKPE